MASGQLLDSLCFGSVLCKREMARVLTSWALRRFSGDSFVKSLVQCLCVLSTVVASSDHWNEEEEDAVGEGELEGTVPGARVLASHLEFLQLLARAALSWSCIGCSLYLEPLFPSCPPE